MLNRIKEGLHHMTGGCCFPQNYIRVAELGSRRTPDNVERGEGAPTTPLGQRCCSSPTAIKTSKCIESGLTYLACAFCFLSLILTILIIVLLIIIASSDDISQWQKYNPKIE